MAEHEDPSEQVDGASSTDYAAMYKEAHPDAVEDIDKAQVMAEAEVRERLLADHKESRAEYNLRVADMAASNPEKWTSTAGGITRTYEGTARRRAAKRAVEAVHHDELAVQRGEEAGRRYDQGKPPKSVWRRFADWVRQDPYVPKKDPEYSLAVENLKQQARDERKK